jgi:hypothetical protein
LLVHLQHLQQPPLHLQHDLSEVVKVSRLLRKVKISPG